MQERRRNQRIELEGKLVVKRMDQGGKIGRASCRERV